ncbi:bifunctional phosphoribosyl-AMP cyclohydrolase/phosphoribosyl-ATP diphosphatase HisIE [Rheinheimera soli]|uniref:Histidine biosynthesis bifunctional protein HisIE n=1 Tax=Rheinheimera soli TaxID=443616 RepID=A0ABU1W445_9GAMM|nr:bifunctional phosphoribosyl-AMP cyclohydrolase/phosphoribosyl-ATP diphosphatase HisIE [Rheinheimera soli]MDR7122742.1 phosphoribosyl-ATP pyrophosphohydrolase/phosphoribosyl-AMP cyclohydrolase [Rheinheimera soli]
MKLNLTNLDQLDFSKGDGLLPVIVQHARSGKVLMQGFANKEALQKSLETGDLTFFSRSKNRLWTKGESSGHTLKLHSMAADCDQDSILALVLPIGPTCHVGTESCWHAADANQPDLAFLDQLEQVIHSRYGADPSSSYTASLFAKGVKRIAQKVGEEGVETALAATVGDREELKNEAADLIYHLLVLLKSQDLALHDVLEVLKQRHQKKS